MTTDEIIQQILLKHPEISRKKLLEKLNEERNKSGDLLEDATLLRLIAVGYGVEIANDSFLKTKLSIAQLVPHLNNVTVSGRVVAVFPVKTFEGKTSGKYASLIIVDADGVLHVMLWNDKADIIESGNLKTGQIARFSHGYTREDRNGKVELHLSDRSKVEIAPTDLRSENYPNIDKFTTKIKEITESCESINLVGVVSKVFPSSTFKRQDLTIGKVLRFRLADDSGTATVVVWNETAGELEDILKEDMTVQLVNARAKTGSDGGFEVHVGPFTYVGSSAVV